MMNIVITFTIFFKPFLYFTYKHEKGNNKKPAPCQHILYFQVTTLVILEINAIFTLKKPIIASIEQIFNNICRSPVKGGVIADLVSLIRNFRMGE